MKKFPRFVKVSKVSVAAKTGKLLSLVNLARSTKFASCSNSARLER